MYYLLLFTHETTIRQILSLICPQKNYYYLLHFAVDYNHDFSIVYFYLRSFSTTYKVYNNNDDDNNNNMY